jgi:S-DNA-T family DNA segregation ATPase FtsK/SpoIIIE
MVMRTKDVRTGALLGGMRGDRSGELQLIAPTPSLTTVVLVNLTRLSGRLVFVAVKHPLAVSIVVVLTSLAALLGWVGPMALSLAALVALPTWWRIGPDSYRRLVTSRWRQVWTYGRWWQPAMVTCGLAQEMNGREYLPKIRKVVGSVCVDRVLVDLLSGQSPEDFERHTMQLAHTFEVQRVRVVVARPGRIWLEFTHRDGLTDIVAPTSFYDTGADSGSKVDLMGLPIGLCEDGSPWRLRLLGSHVLVAGATGSGKGSVVWSLIRAMGPCIRDGSVQVWALDPKGGMELTPGAGLFARFAYQDPTAMVQLLEEAVAFMRARTERLRRAGHRVLTPTAEDPLVVVVVDEMAALTAYAGDRDLKRRAEAALQLLLSQGRAPGVLVVAAVQDPGKDVVTFRDLFPFRIALRLLEDVQVDMVLGRSARHHGAECDLIPPSLPGVGYVIEEGVREPVRVRASYVTDRDLVQMVHDYALHTDSVDGAPPLRMVGES